MPKEWVEYDALLLLLRQGGPPAVAERLALAVVRHYPWKCARSAANKLFLQHMIDGDGHGLIVRAIHYARKGMINEAF